MNKADCLESVTKAPGGVTNEPATGEHDLGILYTCSFSLPKPGGKSAGTRRKLEALEHLSRSLIVVAPARTDTAWAKIAGVVGTELRALGIILWRRKDLDVYISRAFSGVFAIFLAQVLGITTAREIHADAYEEAFILAPKTGLKHWLLRATATITHWLDRHADIRFFNHPALLRWFADSGWQRSYDIAVYNGGRPPTVRLTSQERHNVRQRLSLPAGHTLLVFTGSASPWHGVESLVELQKCFNRYADPIRIVCAGGCTNPMDPKGMLINVSPASEMQCDQFIPAAEQRRHYANEGT